MTDQTRRPILTYGGRGTLKPGVHREDHAVIYTGVGPTLLPGETLSKTALHMEPNDKSQKLDKDSRVNYAKIYTVEHNVKVFFIGALTKNAQAQLGADYNAQHPPIEETAPEDGYIVTRPLGRSNSSNSGQQFEQMATTADRFYGNSGMANVSSSYGLPEDAEPLSSYYNSHDTVSVREPEHSAGYTFHQRTGDTNYSAKGQYGGGEQNEEAQTPRRAASPEEAGAIIPRHENTQEFPT
ncbi:hypothetical protein IFR05_009372 [Cadophora sp. M221]|nr:hypothetical protein IFR05_009372 [Cadophora sp. M221]